jgi:murein L,D-transpeptidase YafK
MGQRDHPLVMRRKMMLTGILIVAAGVFSAYYFYPEKKLPAGASVNRIEVFKSQRKMHAYDGDRLLKTYTVSLGKNPVGTKQCEGNCKTPEGRYTINARNAHSGYHRNLGVSYPEAHDIERANALGKPAGGDIKIHGLKNSSGYIGKFHRFSDWTAGCIAVTNDEIDELFVAVAPDAIIDIRP